MSDVILIQAAGPGYVYGVTNEARKRAIGDAFRAPHYTVSQVGAMAELARAAGGTLYLDEVQEFRIATLAPTLQAWREMVPTARPRLVLGLRLPFNGPLGEHYERILRILPPITEHVILTEDLSEATLRRERPSATWY